MAKVERAEIGVTIEKRAHSYLRNLQKGFLMAQRICGRVSKKEKGMREIYREHRSKLDRRIEEQNWEGQCKLQNTKHWEQSKSWLRFVVSTRKMHIFSWDQGWRNRGRPRSEIKASLWTTVTKRKLLLINDLAPFGGNLAPFGGNSAPLWWELSPLSWKFWRHPWLEWL